MGAAGVSAAEGVIKFQANHVHKPVVLKSASDHWHAFLGWRRMLFELGVVGQDAQRYDGAGYGNMSFRLPPHAADRGERPFVITGTQTGGLAQLRLQDCCVVQSYDIRQNAIHSHGEIKPSSESLTHGAIYDLSPAIRFVFHGHVPLIWQNAPALKLPTTRAHIEYGTQEMATEMRRLYRDSNLAEGRCLAMAGHEDGIISFGRTADEAGEVLVRTLAQAYALV